MKKRISWIDGAKGLGILAVVMFHSGFLLFPEKTVPFVEAWMLPIFLITGGLVFNPEKSFPEFIWSKFKRLMLPFYFFGTVSFIGWLFINQGYAREAIWMPVEEALGFFFKGHDMWFNAPLWFLPSYFLSLVFARVVYPFWKKKQILIKIGIIFSFAAVSFLVIKEGQRTFFSWDLALLFTSFLLFGSLFSKFKEIIIFPLFKTFLIGVIFLQDYI